MAASAAEITLIENAGNGDNESLNRLAKIARTRLTAYVYRLTLDEDLAQDILQETMLEMVRSIGKIREAEKFWAWLFRTALGKVQHHFRGRQRQKLVELSAVEKEHLLKNHGDKFDDGLNGLIRKELAEAILEGMQKIKLRHRSILALRCFEDLSYAEIAETMNLSSELQARVLFFRAKKTLEKQLVHHGFNKKVLVIAVGLFGFLTAPSAKAASAGTLVNAATMDAGFLAVFFGAAFTKINFFVSAVIAAIILNITIEGILVMTFVAFLLIIAFISMAMLASES